MRWRRRAASTRPLCGPRTTNSTGGCGRGGKRWWFDPGLVVDYRPRDTLRDLAWQYFDYGRWKRVVARRHPASLLPRHLAQPAVAAGIGRLAGPGRSGQRLLGGSGSAAHVHPHPDARLSDGRHPSPFVRRAAAPAGPRNHAPELGNRFPYLGSDQEGTDRAPRGIFAPPPLPCRRCRFSSRFGTPRRPSGRRSTRCCLRTTRVR